MKKSDRNLFEFCASFAKRAKSLPDGIYISEDKKHTIQIDKKFERARIGHISGVMQIPYKYKLLTSEDALILVCLWGFKKFKYQSREDFNCDIMAVKLMTECGIRLTKTFFVWFVEWLTNNNPSLHNDIRIINMAEFFRDELNIDISVDDFVNQINKSIKKTGINGRFDDVQKLIEMFNDNREK